MGRALFFANFGRLDARNCGYFDETLPLRFPVDERKFFKESQTSKPANLTCPSCGQSDTYPVRWIVRTKKKGLEKSLRDEDRRKFSQLQSYMVRQDDLVGCKNPRCRKRIEITSLQSIVFV